MYDIIISDVRMMVANTSMYIISRNIRDVRMMVANVSLCIISCNNEAHMIALSSWAIRFLTFSQVQLLLQFCAQLRRGRIALN